MRYLLLPCLSILLFACDKKSSLNEQGKFDFAQNLPGKNFPEYLYKPYDTLTKITFYPQINDLVIQLMRDENLSENYLNKSVIRVTFTSAFGYEHFVSVSLVNENGKIYLVEKESYSHDILDSTSQDSFLHFLEYDSVKKHFKNVAYSLKGDSELIFQNEKEIDPLIYSQKQEVNRKVWDEAVSQLNQAVFALKPSEVHNGLDGHDITFETHFPDGFYAVKRWAPTEKHKEFRALAYSILSLGERWKIEGHLKSVIREIYPK